MKNKDIKKFQEIFKKQYGKDLPWDEAAKSADNLVRFYELLFDIHYKELCREKKLKDHPKGYHLDDGGTYTCFVCGNSVCNETSWYDQSGIKCLHCQNAINKRHIPRKICKNKDLYYSTWEFEKYFDMKSPTVTKCVREGKLKPRIVKNTETGRQHYKLFLISDNKDVLPEKPKSYSVDDGNGWTHMENDKIDLKKVLDELEI